MSVLTISGTIPEKMNDNRRQFIKKGALLIAATPLIGISGCSKDKEIKKCTTADDILGPYYRESAPFRADLNVNNQPGTQLTLGGTVFGIDCETPLNEAVVDVWHADDTGDYDNSSNNYAFRGKINTDPNGRYEFSTIFPGQYLLGGGSNYRPGHIHFKITASNHKDLVTQLYFTGDPFIPSDPWASQEDAAERIITLTLDGNGNKTGVFNIRLTPS